MYFSRSVISGKETKYNSEVSIRLKNNDTSKKTFTIPELFITDFEI